jgi:hypothetical protein
MTTTAGGLATLTGLQAFHPVSVDGEAYTADDLRAAALNWSEFKDRVEPPVVLGHEEHQPLTAHLANTGIPAVGWVSGVRFGEEADRNGTVRPVLLNDLAEVQPEVAHAINARKYKKVSVEMWRRPPEQVFDGRQHILDVLGKRGIDPAAALAEAEAWAPGEHARLTAAHESGRLAKVPARDWLVDYKLRDKLGSMLRRLAVLGGEVPRLGTLTDLPAAVFSERRRDGLHTDEQYEAFMSTAAADTPADDTAAPPAKGGGAAKRQKLEDVLRRAGWPDSLITALDALPHSAMNDFVLAALEHAAGTGPDAQASADPAAAPAVAAEEAAEPPATEAAEDAGTPDVETMVADLVAMGQDEAALRAMTPEDLLKLWTEKKGSTMSAPRTTATPPPDAAFAARMADVDRRLAETEKLVRAREKAAAESERAARARLVDGLLEDLNAGPEPRIVPAEVPRLRRQLLAADNATVKKFGDKDCTEFEDLVDGLRARPRLRFFGAEKAQTGGGVADPFAEKVKAHYAARAAKRTG